MTEREWLTASGPAAMLVFLARRAGVRKRRLFACACVRRIWHLLGDPRSRRAIEVAEAFADGEVDREVVKSARREAVAASRLALHRVWSPADAAEICLLQSTEDLSTAARAATAASQAGVPLSSEREAQAHLLRDLFGNPFRPLAIVPSWLTPTVQQLAQAAYHNRLLPSGHLDPACLAVLADALEEAGCPSSDLLDHLRGAGPHVRGCHAVDRLLAKA